ncbi:MAG: putative toxin-antitoxin system toxin component, PIN family [Dehalococcoidales bacterium]|nr:putative toxin-antitoxin system toxin component, PIN family [Dehalococcoidales bacterium]
MVQKPDILVFLDTNVIFSALYSSHGHAATILEHYFKGNIRIIISQCVLEESIRILKEKLPNSLAAFNALLVNAPPLICKDPSNDEITRWSSVINTDDAKILASAVAIRADYLITGDTHFYNKNISEKSGLKIVTPAQFIKEYEKR